MKAKEYFDKYERAIIEDFKEDATSSTSKLLLEMSEEIKEILHKRNAKSNSAVLGGIKEGNQKWNAICNLFIKKYGFSPLRENGLFKYWEMKIPGLTIENEKIHVARNRVGKNG